MELLSHSVAGSVSINILLKFPNKLIFLSDFGLTLINNLSNLLFKNILIIGVDLSRMKEELLKGYLHRKLRGSLKNGWCVGEKIRIRIEKKKRKWQSKLVSLTFRFILKLYNVKLFY